MGNEVQTSSTNREYQHVKKAEKMQTRRRNKNPLFPLSLIFGFCFLYAGAAFADEKDELIEKLIKRVDQLENKVENLTDRLSVYEQKPAVAVSEEAIQKKVDEALAKKGEQGLSISMPKISGFIDTTYNYNFNRPATQTTKLGTPGGTTAGVNLSS